MHFIKLYIVAFTVFLIIDMIWLGAIAKKLYQQQIGFLMTHQIRWGAAFLFYAIYIGGLVFFALLPAIENDSAMIAIFHGALLGLVCYATYDLTNLATIKNWPLTIVVYDLVWGTFLSALTTWISFWIATHWKAFFH